MKTTILRNLGDVKGSLRYKGMCAVCGMQFMSDHDRVAVQESGRLICAKCATAEPSRETAAHSATVNFLRELRADPVQDAIDDGGPV